MPILSFGEYRPDVADYEGSTSKDIVNVVPHGDGYGPFLSFAAFSGAMAAPCRGIFYALKNDGTILVFAGTSTKLYTLNATTGAWTDASLAGGSYSALAADRNWSFAQFNNFVIATQRNAVVQVYDLTGAGPFANLGGSPPQADFVSVVNRFLVLSGIASPNVYRIQWSGLNATTTWTSGVSQSDFQDLADGGLVRGIAGGEYGTIFQDRSIRRMTYAPGSPYIFGIDRISADDGLYAPYSLIAGSDRIFFCSPQGFKMIQPGGYPEPIGKERVDRTFFADVDNGNLQLFIGTSDPRHNRVYWAYKSNSGTAGQFDKILCYDWALNRWTLLRISGEYLAPIAQPGTTLEGVDAAYGNNIDTLTLPTFDNIPAGNQAAFAAVDTNNKLGFFSGATLEATMETSEHGGDGKRIFIPSFRPITDAATLYGSVSQREREETANTYSSEVLLDSIGQVQMRVSTRYARAKVRIPAGTSWTYAAGVEPQVVLEGER